ncbi:unnamed protein product, partial [Heterotrigona itama]
MWLHDGSTKERQNGQASGYTRWYVPRMYDGRGSVEVGYGGRAKGNENEKEAAGGREGGCEFGGSRFPRDVGRKVPAGPVLSPRQDDQPAVSNIKPTCTGSLSSTRIAFASFFSPNISKRIMCKKGTARMALDGRKNMPMFPRKRESDVCNHTGCRLQAAVVATFRQ